ncbi:MAG: enoyl-CoA hydratase-related protein [Opitutaceae bacterium]
MTAKNTESDLFFDRSGSIATLTLNRPHVRNAISYGMYERLPHILSRVEADDEVKVLVLRGAGNKAFAAGADIKEFRTLRADGAGARIYNAAVASAEHAISRLSKPTIAMVHGFCIGGGCGLALACDFRIADTKSAFGITPARLGLVYSLESTKRLIDVVGPAEASFILFSGRHVDADRALRTGLANELHEPEDLAAATYTLASEISQRAPMSLRRTKEIIHLIEMGQASDDAHTIELRDSSFDSLDYSEGVAAFLEKRPAKFVGS